jgi:acetate---CoA ligase (ADP-forming)
VDSGLHTQPLEALFAPSAVAIVGASEERHYSRSIIGNLRQQGYPDSSILPVNPRYTEISGLPCYPSLADLPVQPDTVAALIGKAHVATVLDDAIRAGARGALLIADGFAEESAAGLAEQQALGAAAAAAGLALLGPNTLGYVDPHTGAGMWCAGVLPAALRPGGAAILSQSSGILNLIMGMAGRRLLGVRACVSVGNAERIGLPDLITHFAADDKTAVLSLIVESIDRPRALLDALLLARAAGKPVIVLKIGVSELGRQNSVAHTGRMAGPEQGWSAMFDKLGVHLARDLDDFMETTTLFAGLVPGLRDQPADRGLGVAFATISGGETSLICDVAAQEGLELTALAPHTMSTLREGQGKPSMIGNPLDLQNSRTAKPEVFWGNIRAVCIDPSVDVLAVRFNMAERRTAALDTLYREVVEVVRETDILLVVVSRAYEYLDAGWWELFDELGVPFVLSYRNAIRGFAALRGWFAQRSGTDERPTAVPTRAGVELTSREPLGPVAASEWLTAAGVDVARNGTARTPGTAAKTAADIGWPVVLKAQVPGLVHKSEVGGVVLDLGDVAAVEAAAEAMSIRVAEAMDISPSDVGFELQRMISSGTELILGMVPDPTWGPVVMLGAGGIYAETLGDVVWDLPPISPGRARTLLSRLRIWPILNGVRNQPPADIEAVIDTVVSFSAAIAAAGSQLAAVDVNPVVVSHSGTGLTAVDAVIIPSTSGEDPA